MTEHSPIMQMANLVCRFGPEKVMLDLVDEIVIPAFSESPPRFYGSTSYHFHNVRVLNLGERDGELFLGIAGRFIKNMKLEREQLYDPDQGLIQANASLDSSPSAIFLLILNNHRLVYVAETKYAPSIESFRSTLHAFLRQKYAKYIDEKYLENSIAREEDPSVKKITKQQLREEVQRPTLELTHLTSGESIEQFVRQYKTLKSVEIIFSDRNDETDTDDFFDALQKKKDSIGSNRTALIHKSKAGLDQNEAITEITESTSQGNQSVRLDGVDQAGDKLRGNNEDFQLKVPLDRISKDPAKAGIELFSKFCGLLSDGMVRVRPTPPRAREIITDLFRRYF